ncbi:MAG: carbon-nitrogen hydrolase family protein [Candidatus Pacearchaeota archaeon]
MKKNPIIALAPIKYFNISEKDNLEKIRAYIHMASKKGADIICFPESCVHKTAVITLKNPILKEIQEECKKHSIWCIITEDINHKGRDYNTAVLINRKGEIAGNYKKINLYGDKTEAGTRVKVFKTDFATIGIVICWDLAFPRLFQKMKEEGAEIIFCPAQWCYEKKAYDNQHKKRETLLLKALVSARAFENLFFVAICNPLINEKDLVSYSAIVSPHRILKEAIKKEDLIVAEINLKEIEKSEKLYDKI